MLTLTFISLITTDFQATVLPQYSKVSKGVCSLISVLWYLPVRSTLIKNLHKTWYKLFFIITWQIIFFPFFFLFDKVLSISEYVLERNWLLSILMKNLTKRCTNNFVISRVSEKTFSACRIWFGKRKIAVLIKTSN